MHADNTWGLKCCMRELTISAIPASPVIAG
jgi:hypothetical protein